MALTERLVLECIATGSGGMTLHELSEFVKRAEAKNVDPATPLGAIVSWRGRIKQIKVEL